MTCKNNFPDKDSNWRLVLMSGKWYAAPYDELEWEWKTLEPYIAEGTLVLLCDDLGWAASELGIDVDDIHVEYPDEGGG